MNKRTATVLVDALFLILLVFVILPQNPERREDPAIDLFSPMLVGIRWPDGMYTDVDLWVRAPGDVPVGFSHLRGGQASLLRDDVGNTKEDPVVRYEIAAFIRLADGEYVINLVLYADQGNNRPVPVEVRVWRNLPGDVKEIYRTTAVLRTIREEITVVRFTLDRGQMVPGSIHTTPLALFGGRRP